MKVLLLGVVLILVAVIWFQNTYTTLSSCHWSETVYSRSVGVMSEHADDGDSDVLSWCRDAAAESLRFVVNILDSEQYAPGVDEKATAIFKPVACVLFCVLGLVLLVKLVQPR